MNILITGGRSPVALDLGRTLSKEGCNVFVADSLSVYLSKGSKVFSKAYVLPKPAYDCAGFIEKLQQIILAEKIDLLIPTCEEVFFIAKYKDRLSCTVFCEEFSKLEALHNKYKFPLWINDNITNAKAPQTHLIKSIRDLKHYKNNSDSFVFKPVYSRFAAYTLIKPKEKELAKKCNPQEQNPWVAQEYIKGKEYCTYSIAHQGKLMAHATYVPVYRLGLGASMYFSSVQQSKIESFIEEFVSKQNYTGQIGFDIIEDSNGELYILECNPRGTSGIHFLKGQEMLPCLTGLQEQLLVPKFAEARMSAMAMMVIGLFKYSFRTPIQLLKHLKQASDVIYDREDPWPTIYQFYVLAFITASAIKHKSSLHAISSVDMEWNGQVI